MRELGSGVWFWQAPHPDWEPGAHWPELVSSYALDDGERLLLFDPIAPPSEIAALVADRDAAVVLTSAWHERDTRELVERFGLPVFVPQPDRGRSDVAWLFGEGGRGQARVYTAKAGLPAGLRGFAGRVSNEFVLWMERHRALIAGDTFVDLGRGLEIPPEWRAEETRDQIANRLRVLLDLPVELVLPAHGEPADRAALERVLA